MDFDEMSKAMERVRANVYRFPMMTTSYLIEKERLEHILNTAPEAVMERPTPNIKEFADKTQMGIPEVMFTGWEQLLNFMKEYDRMSSEVTRLSSALNRQRNEVISILQNAIDQISRQLRESSIEDQPPSTDNTTD
jgi:hypothetical protein